MTCCCQSIDPSQATLVPPAINKRVNYVLGMVLGVDDLTQESAYLDGRVQTAVRELIGYGVDRGLGVMSEVGEKGPVIRVTPGVAYAPTGEMICVDTDQCCYLNDWLKANAGAVNALLPGLDYATLTLHIGLCYRECLTDKVPIPGDPCRSEDSLMQYSRIKDAYSIELRFTPPRQTEEDALREFVRWLRLIPVVDSSQPVTVEELLAAIRTAASPWLSLASPPDCPEGSPPTSSPPEFMLGDPPADLTVPRLACLDYWREAFRLWVTELRPVWIARFGGCHAGCAKPCPQEDCLLLATLEVPVLLQSPGAWEVSDIEPVIIDRSRCPYLLHARMMQEWLLSLCDCGSGTPSLPDLGGDLSGPIGNGTVKSIQGVAVEATGARAKQVLTYEELPSGGVWLPQDLPGAVAFPPLGGDLAGAIGDGTVKSIQGVAVEATGAKPKQVLTYEELPSGGVWLPQDLPGAVALPPLGGDLSGPIGNGTVNKIQGVKVQAQGATANQVLTFVGDTWQPQSLPLPAPPVLPMLAGDAIGPVGNNQVKGLWGGAIPQPPAPPAGDPSIPQALSFDNGWTFTPVSGACIVAAGRFGFDKTGKVAPFTYSAKPPPAQSPFNGLTCLTAAPANPPALPWRIKFGFDKYEWYLANGVLIVKATPGWLLGTDPPPTLGRDFPDRAQRTLAPFFVYFSQFEKRDFELLITALNAETLTTIGAGELEIEVSWYQGK